MVQGTASSVGKSVMTTALCRFFKQEGFKVAPFKSQNMSNNSYVTGDGGEIGRAQAVQAMACGIRPTVYHNPILLKPTTDIGAQVIILGKPVGILSARQYHDYQKKALPAIEEALDHLRSEYDLVVIEGAGSPAEVNLYDHDIVNMKIARMTDASVILVGDIDLGGVFAAFVGTLELLPAEDRKRIRGFLINKFRGDITLLEPGLDFLEQKTGIPVLGVLPYDENLCIPEEDGVYWAKNRDRVKGRGLSRGERPFAPTSKILIHVVEFPRISNHTDFEPLMKEHDVELRYIREVPAEVPDVLILPGTRSTMADLEFLRRQGFFKFIREQVQKGMRLIGICGGYQMLGEKIVDPDSVEGNRPEIEGFGFFPIVTHFSRGKMTTQVRGVHLESGEAVEGYEIHMGFTQCSRGDACVAPTPVFQINERGSKQVSLMDGAITEDQRIWGSYIHGLFDATGFRRYFLNQIRREKGWEPLTPAAGIEDYSAQFDRAADMIRRHVKTEKLYEWIGMSCKSQV